MYVCVCVCNLKKFIFSFSLSFFFFVCISFLRLSFVARCALAPSLHPRVHEQHRGFLTNRPPFFFLPATFIPFYNFTSLPVNRADWLSKYVDGLQGVQRAHPAARWRQRPRVIVALQGCAGQVGRDGEQWRRLRLTGLRGRRRPAGAANVVYVTARRHTDAQPSQSWVVGLRRLGGHPTPSRGGRGEEGEERQENCEGRGAQ